jgi:gas vesicle protein
MFKNILFIILLVGIVALPTIVLYAQDKGGETKSNILLEAAEVLKDTYPDLSAGLVKYAKYKSMELAELTNFDRKEIAQELIKEKKDQQLLKDAIAALKSSYPDLAQRLTEYLKKQIDKINLTR